MEWLKKHWGWIAAIAVGIPVLYWLYQTYQTNAANNAQNAQQTDLQNQEEADAASYAQQIALGNLSGGIGSSSPGAASSGPVTSSAPSTPISTSVSSIPPSTAGTSIVSPSPSATSWYGEDPSDYGLTADQADTNAAANILDPNGLTAEQQADINAAANILDPNGPQTSVSAPAVNTPAKSQTYGTVTTLLGTGAAAIQQNQTAPPRAPVTTTPPAHITSGSIEQHNNILPSSPTSKELSSISPGRG